MTKLRILAALMLALSAAPAHAELMSELEKESQRIAINKCWNTAELSSKELHTVVTLHVEMSEAGKPTFIEMKSFSGGNKASALRVFETAKRAVLRCAGQGYDLDPAKYDQWKVLNLIFAPTGTQQK